MQPQAWDVLTIGGGPGATPGAQFLAAHGKRVAIIEQGLGLGGTCLFEGCIPSKIYLETAGRLRAIREGAQFGIVGADYTGLDLARLRERKARILSQRVIGASKSSEALGITVLQGVADIIDSRHVSFAAAGQDPVTLEAETLIISPGSVSRELNVPGANGLGVWTSAEALAFSEIPERLCIIGGGYIGIELATMYRSFGSHVHILEEAPRILLTEDPLVVTHLTESWQKVDFGVTIETSISLTRIDDAGGAEGHKVVYYQTAAGLSATLEADRVLIAVGREPNTAGLQWSQAGITLGKRGEVPVNSYYQTSVANIYAPGDVNGHVMLAHAATRQSLICAQHILGLETFPRDLIVPHVVFSSPEIAAVGVDSRALVAHPNFRLTRWRYAQDARALIVGDELGYAQLIWDQETHEVRGLQVVGADAGELVEEVTYLITHHGTVESLAVAIHPHPTLSEVISELAMAAWSESQAL
ncbi:NAD(P)/FAD-dependent oxidoreductase [Ferrimicrobium sp.]|uniref:dihydrolipoyl dehydrogenase family protein n=1 Tax=Ferrimicrobium sp. TaxID=2926050 RepID=UPI002626FB7E|nr:NAD(P)/FAD-dependent oxidoreductase [Ferrimicrobium sp.]